MTNTQKSIAIAEHLILCLSKEYERFAQMSPEADMDGASEAILKLMSINDRLSREDSIREGGDLLLGEVLPDGASEEGDNNPLPRDN